MHYQHCKQTPKMNGVSTFLHDPTPSPAVYSPFSPIPTQLFRKKMSSPSSLTSQSCTSEAPGGYNATRVKWIEEQYFVHEAQRLIMNYYATVRRRVCVRTSSIMFLLSRVTGCRQVLRCAHSLSLVSIVSSNGGDTLYSQTKHMDIVLQLSVCMPVFLPSPL